MTFKQTLILAVIVFSIYVLVIQPSNDRDWISDHEILSHATINADHVLVHNIRNFTYNSTEEYSVDYYDKRFELSQLNSVWYVVVPFGEWEGPAHTFLSFGFTDDSFLAVSIEARREEGESYSPITGLARSYELMYVLGDERDLIKLRSNYRGDEVFVYPVKASPEVREDLFLDMLERTNKLVDKPEFYNTVSNSCTTNIVRHVRRVSDKHIPFSYKTALPAFSDELAYDIDLIDTNLSFDEMRAKYQINERAKLYANDTMFSVRIRE